MASTKEIKNRMESIKDTEKITNAMYLIASTKLKKAKAAADRSDIFFNALKNETGAVLKNVSPDESIYCRKSDGSNKTLYLVIGSDRGMAGSYNQNILRKLEQIMASESDAMFFCCR